MSEEVYDQARDHDLRKRISDAQAAYETLQSEYVQHALERVEAKSMVAWQQSSFNDTDGREDCYRMVRATHELKQELQRMVNDGKVARSELEKREKRKQTGGS